MTLDKLKVAARQHEQRDEWRAAIDLYRQAIHTAEAGEGAADPSLYNRIGDLEQREGNHRAACEAWEQAASRYGEQGFFNNAIALCSKILRLDPSRARTYLDLARFQARKRVIYDVRHNLEQYLAQMQHRGESDQAATDIEQLAADFPAWKDLGRTVNELLGREIDADGGDGPGDHDRAGGLVFLDTDRQASSDVAPMATVPDPAAPLVLEPTENSTGDLAADPTAIDGLERASEEFDPSLTTAVDDVPGLIGFERTAADAPETEQLVGLEGPAVAAEAAEEAAAEAITLDGLETTAVSAPDPAAARIDTPPPAPTDGIIFLDTSTAPEDAPPEPIDVSVPPEPVVATSAPLDQRAEGHERLEQGDRQGAVEALERALAGYLEAGQLDRAFHVASELVDAQPAVIDRYQTRVEVAVRLRDPASLCTAYLDLADALARLGQSEKAVAVYRRVLEIDESHAAARAALRKMAPDAAPAETADGFIDFGALVNDDVGPRSTRMRTETTTISDNEDETFQEALAEFKRALDQNISVDDHQAHYDLGVAFKEMGLLDEAIGEFQKALHSPDGRLRTSEALGQAFFEQGRPAVAEAVLRSVEKGDEGDAAMIGVLYWLGRALEAQGKTRNARGYYERVLAVDVGFHDVTARIGALADGNG